MGNLSSQSPTKVQTTDLSDLWTSVEILDFHHFTVSLHYLYVNGIWIVAIILASFTIDLADTGDGMDMKKKHMFAGILNIHNLHYHTLPTLIRKFVNCVHDWVIQYLVVLSSGAFTSIKWAFKCVQLVKSH